jgi:Ca-activated chloride channel homolog
LFALLLAFFAALLFLLVGSLAAQQAPAPVPAPPRIPAQNSAQNSAGSPAGAPAQPPSKLPARNPLGLPRPRQLDKGIRFERGAASGELRVLLPGATASASLGAAAPASAAALHATTEVVALTCVVSTPQGDPVPGLRRDDFLLYSDDLPQTIAYFDASAQPASVALVIDASPSVLRDSAEMKQAADALVGSLAPLDEAAVIDFSSHTYLQLPFSDVREQIRRAVARVDPTDLLGDLGGSNIYEAVYLTAQNLFPGRTGRKAIVLLTDGQDSGLGLTLDPASTMPPATPPSSASRNAAPARLTFDDVARLLAHDDIQLFAVSTENRPRIMTPEWIAAHQNATLISQNAQTLGIPTYTLYLAELVRRAGGQLYFLNESATAADTFRQIAAKIRAEYTLGFYPSRDSMAASSPAPPPAAPLASSAVAPPDSAPAALAAPSDSPPASPPAQSPLPGWHSLRVEVIDQPDARVSHRAAFYIPAPK